MMLKCLRLRLSAKPPRGRPGICANLQDAGISQEQAYCQSPKLALTALSPFREEVFNSQELATKDDIAKIEQSARLDIARLENKLTHLESNMDAKMSAMEVRIMCSTYNAMFVLVAAMCAISAVIVALASFRVASSNSLNLHKVDLCFACAYLKGRWQCAASLCEVLLMPAAGLWTLPQFLAAENRPVGNGTPAGRFCYLRFIK